ncbi:MAG: hypothetical protein VSS75_000140 [Candidatus Parabeggiatoa sp.]|nr:hypothetical protein [Candidatus Parabeggiatoa sp.]
MTDFGESWVNSPVERWATILLKSGILFVLGGLAAWAWDNHWQPLYDFMQWLNDGEAKAVPTLLFLFGLLIIMATASSILKHFDLLILRLLEGYYWPQWLRDWKVDRQNVRFERQSQRFQELARKPHLPPKESAKLARLDEQLMFIPKERHLRMPTELGNLLRMVELRPEQKYGLNAFICWPRLWLVLPTEAKHELANARDKLDTMVRTWTWSLLFMVWSVWAWWIIPLGLIALLVTYFWLLQAAKIYGQLLESSFDLYRHLLYKELRWPLPQSPAEEKAQGEQLTAYLWRGSEQDTPKFL